MKILIQLVKKLDKIIELLTAEKEHREEVEQAKLQKERDEMLMEYARKHNKKFPAAGIHSSNELRERPVEGAKDYIPYGLSDLDKEILKMWYDDSNPRGQ